MRPLGADDPRTDAALLAAHGAPRLEWVAPHGLMGQSWDGDDLAVDGALDDYHRDEPSPAVVTTAAMAEGAIEGAASDYRLASPFATTFKFSRFDATAHVPPRDVSRLRGTKRPRNRTALSGSTEDGHRAVALTALLPLPA